MRGDDGDMNDATRTLVWPHGRAELQRLGGMLAPIVFSAPGHADFSPMQVAPWADEPGADALPGILQRLRGEWPCVPFGRSDRPDGLPPGWQSHDAGDAWGHGYAAHHAWSWAPSPDASSLVLKIDTPDGIHLIRTVSAVADAPALDISLRIEVERPCTLPISLHPTLRLDAGRVALDVRHNGTGLTYPVPAEPEVSHLAPNREFASLRQVPLADGGVVDLTRFPQARDSEELLQVQQVTGPVTLHYLDQAWALSIDWDRALLPDVMLWVSHRGRRHSPWNGRHWALGVEPVNGVFDLGRVAQPPADHPLAARRGLTLDPRSPCVLRYRFEARPT